MVTSSKGVSAIQVSDLPVRQVNIFGRQLVIPKDTVYEVEIFKEVTVPSLPGIDNMKFVFQVGTRVILSHSYFPRKTKETSVVLFEAVTENEVWIKKRLRRASSGFFEPRYWVLSNLEKKIKRAQITDAILKMFLAGDINRDGLLKFLPKQDCLG